MYHTLRSHVKSFTWLVASASCVANLHQAVIRQNPKDLVAFSAEYFRNKAGIAGDPVPGSDIVARD